MSKPRTAEEALTAEVEALEKQREALTTKIKGANDDRALFERKAEEAKQRVHDLEDERMLVVDRMTARKTALEGLRRADTSLPEATK